METGSVLACYLVTDGWYSPKKGVITNTGSIEGGHAILLVGWKRINDEDYWIILNSWGEEWGNKGFGYIPATEQILEAYCILDEVHELKLKDESENSEG